MYQFDKLLIAEDNHYDLFFAHSSSNKTNIKVISIAIFLLINKPTTLAAKKVLLPKWAMSQKELNITAVKQIIKTRI